MRHVLHSLVYADILEAMEFYEREGGPKLAADFFKEFERVANSILDRPSSYPIIKGAVRRAHLQRFPFNLIFSIEPTYIFILVIRHNRRQPDFGLDR